VTDDDLFEQLFRLFQSEGPVNWKLAHEVTKSIAGQREPVEPDLAEEYVELAKAAEIRLQAITALPAPSPGDLNPTDPATWALENERTFRILVEPLADKLSGGFGEIQGAGGMGAMLQPLGPALLGMQAGTMVGFMAHRVLGQFDTGIPAIDHDRPYVVVPNVESFSMDDGFDPRQVRLWTTLHEMTFQRLMEIEWLRGHFVSAVDGFFESVEFDLSGLMGTLSSMQDPAQMQELLGGGDSPSPAMLRGTSDPERLASVQATSAFVEGYGDYTVRLAGAELLPDLDRIEQAYNRRRAEPSQAEQYLQQMVGFDLQRHRAADAASFCDQVIRRWGVDALDTAWSEPDHLPTLPELTDPVGWAARTLLD